MVAWYQKDQHQNPVVIETWSGTLHVSKGGLERPDLCENFFASVLVNTLVIDVKFILSN